MITLTSQLQLLVGGTAQETDAAGALVGLAVNWQLNTLTAELMYGSFAAGVFTPGTLKPSVFINLNLTTGVWSASTGQTGTLSAPALASVVANFKSDRNTIEGFAAANNVMPGTPTAWT